MYTQAIYLAKIDSELSLFHNFTVSVAVKPLEKFNRYAEILVLTESGKKLGYVPEKDNVVFSRLMDAGKLLTAKINRIKKISDSYTQIGIDIYLVDF